MIDRDWLLAAGVLAAVGGLAMAYVPSLATVEAPTTVPFLVSVLALAAALVRGRAWLGHESRDARPTERERPTAVGVPGDDFDETLARAPPVGTSASRGGADRRRIVLRQSLREAAVETLVAFQGYTESEAERAIDAGTWTDDRFAAEFFTTPRGEGTSLSDSVRGNLYGDGPYRERAGRAASEIERLGRGEGA